MKPLGPMFFPWKSSRCDLTICQHKVPLLKSATTIRLFSSRERLAIFAWVSKCASSKSTGKRVSGRATLVQLSRDRGLSFRWNFKSFFSISVVLLN